MCFDATILTFLRATFTNLTKKKKKWWWKAFAIYMLSAACLSQQNNFHMQQVQMQTAAYKGN